MSRVSENDIEILRDILNLYPQLKFVDSTFPLDPKDEQHSKEYGRMYNCEDIHNLAYNDALFAGPIILTSFMIYYKTPVSVYHLPEGMTMNQFSNKKAGIHIPLTIDETHEEIINELRNKGLFKIVPPVAIVVQKYQNRIEKRIAIFDLNTYQRNLDNDNRTGLVHLLEIPKYVKHNWGSIMLLTRQTIMGDTLSYNQDKRIYNENSKAILRVKKNLINLFSTTMGYRELGSTCPQTAVAAAAAIHYELTVNTMYIEQEEQARARREQEEDRARREQEEDRAQREQEVQREERASHQSGRDSEHQPPQQHKSTPLSIRKGRGGRSGRGSRGGRGSKGGGRGGKGGGNVFRSSETIKQTSELIPQILDYV